MTTEHVLVIGGGSGMGLALAELLLAGGAEVTIAGRSADRLAAAAKLLDRPDRLRTGPVDGGREDPVRRVAGSVGGGRPIPVASAGPGGAGGAPAAVRL